MLARLQQIITLTLALAALIWAAMLWAISPFIAISGLLIILFGYAVILGLEFLALRLAGAADPAPAPSIRQLLRAWMGETLMGPRVFCWRQPFRSNAVPDQLQTHASHGQRGVVLVHGFFCNRGFWTPWLERLQVAGHPFVAVNLEPVFGSIDEYANVIDAAVQDVTSATGSPPVLVCHSMGGLAARAWLRKTGGATRVHHVITIGTPHHGTWLGRFSNAANGSEMRQSSNWLGKLRTHEAGSGLGKFTCWYSNCDNIVFPVSSATLPGADNRLVEGVAHVQLAFAAEVMDGSLAIIGAMCDS